MSARYCEKCQKDLTDNERNLEAVAGDCLCVQCRSDSSWHIKEQKYADFIAACPALESLCEALVPNQLRTWEVDMEDESREFYRLRKGLLEACFISDECCLILLRRNIHTGSPEWVADFSACAPPTLVLGAISAALATGEHESKI